MSKIAQAHNCPQDQTSPKYLIIRHREGKNKKNWQWPVVTVVSFYFVHLRNEKASTYVAANYICRTGNNFAVSLPPSVSHSKTVWSVQMPRQHQRALTSTLASCIVNREIFKPLAVKGCTYTNNNNRNIQQNHSHQLNVIICLFHSQFFHNIFLFTKVKGVP
jgi:hypothetical protein